MLFIPSSVFFISGIIFFNPGWLFFIFSNSKLFVTFHSASILFPGSWIIVISLNSLSGRLHTHHFSCSEVLPCSFIWICSSFSSFSYTSILFLCIWKISNRSQPWRSGPLWRYSMCLAVHSLLRPNDQGPTCPQVGSDLCLQTQFHRLWDCISHVSGVCPLVDSSQRNSCRLPAVRSWCLPSGGGSELCICAGGHGQFKDISRSGSGFRKPLGTMSIDKWVLLLYYCLFGLKHTSPGA